LEYGRYEVEVGFKEIFWDEAKISEFGDLAGQLLATPFMELG
jgi:hypothetical protein